MTNPDNESAAKRELCERIAGIDDPELLTELANVVSVLLRLANTH